MKNVEKWKTHYSKGFQISIVENYVQHQNRIPNNSELFYNVSHETR